MDAEIAKATPKQIMDATVRVLSRTDASGRYAGLLQSWYPAKRKAPDSIGRMIRQWVFVHRDLLTIPELHSLARAALQQGRIDEAHALLEERGLLNNQ